MINKIALNIFTLIIVFSPLFVFAQSASPYTGLIRCDGVVTEAGQVKCGTLTFIHNINWLINWAFGIVVLVALCLFAYAGVLYIWAGMSGDYGKTTQAKGFFSNVLIGLFWMSTGWLIIKILISFLTGGKYGMDFL